MMPILWMKLQTLMLILTAIELIIVSIKTIKRQNKKYLKDEVFELVNDALEEAITMESIEKSSELLQASHSMKCNIISNRACLSSSKHSSFPKVRAQNTSSVKNDFEDFKSNFMETLNVTYKQNFL